MCARCGGGVATCALAAMVAQEVEEAVRLLDEEAQRLQHSSGYALKMLPLPLYAGAPPCCPRACPCFAVHFLSGLVPMLLSRPRLPSQLVQACSPVCPHALAVHRPARVPPAAGAGAGAARLAQDRGGHQRGRDEPHARGRRVSGLRRAVATERSQPEENQGQLLALCEESSCWPARVTCTARTTAKQEQPDSKAGAALFLSVLLCVSRERRRGC